MNCAVSLRAEYVPLGIGIEPDDSLLDGFVGVDFEDLAQLSDLENAMDLLGYAAELDGAAVLFGGVIDA
jgi:hypothetical protein